MVKSSRYSHATHFATLLFYACLTILIVSTSTTVVPLVDASEPFDTNRRTLPCGNGSSHQTNQEHPIQSGDSVLLKDCRHITTQLNFVDTDNCENISIVVVNATFDVYMRGSCTTTVRNVHMDVSDSLVLFWGLLVSYNMKGPVQNVSVTVHSTVVNLTTSDPPPRGYTGSMVAFTTDDSSSPLSVAAIRDMFISITNCHIFRIGHERTRDSFVIDLYGYPSTTHPNVSGTQIHVLVSSTIVELTHSPNHSCYMGLAVLTFETGNVSDSSLSINGGSQVSIGSGPVMEGQASRLRVELDVIGTVFSVDTLRAKGITMSMADVSIFFDERPMFLHLTNRSMYSVLLLYSQSDAAMGLDIVVQVSRVRVEAYSKTEVLLIDFFNTWNASILVQNVVLNATVDGIIQGAATRTVGIVGLKHTRQGIVVMENVHMHSQMTYGKIQMDNSHSCQVQSRAISTETLTQTRISFTNGSLRSEPLIGASFVGSCAFYRETVGLIGMETSTDVSVVVNGCDAYMLYRPAVFFAGSMSAFIVSFSSDVVRVNVTVMSRTVFCAMVSGTLQNTPLAPFTLFSATATIVGLLSTVEASTAAIVVAANVHIQNGNTTMIVSAFFQLTPETTVTSAVGVNTMSVHSIDVQVSNVFLTINPLSYTMPQPWVIFTNRGPSSFVLFSKVMTNCSTGVTSTSPSVTVTVSESVASDETLLLAVYKSFAQATVMCSMPVRFSFSRVRLVAGTSLIPSAVYAPPTTSALASFRFLIEDCSMDYALNVFSDAVWTSNTKFIVKGCNLIRHGERLTHHSLNVFPIGLVDTLKSSCGFSDSLSPSLTLTEDLAKNNVVRTLIRDSEQSTAVAVALAASAVTQWGSAVALQRAAGAASLLSCAGVDALNEPMDLGSSPTQLHIGNDLGSKVRSFARRKHENPRLSPWTSSLYIR